MYDLSSARDGNKDTSRSLFLVSSDLAVIHLCPSSPLPPCSAHTCEQTLLRTLGRKPGADIISPGPAWRSPQLEWGAPACFCLVSAALSHPQAGLVTICTGKAAAAHEPPSQRLQARVNPDIKQASCRTWGRLLLVPASLTQRHIFLLPSLF